MNLAGERLREPDNPSLTADARAALRAQVAADLTHKGQYETAREALGEFWREWASARTRRAKREDGRRSALAGGRAVGLDR
jgi:hypothetical protein